MRYTLFFVKKKKNEKRVLAGGRVEVGKGKGRGEGNEENRKKPTSPLLMPNRASISQLSSTRAAYSLRSRSSKLSGLPGSVGGVGIGTEEDNTGLLEPEAGARDLPLEGGGALRGGWARDWRS